MKNFSMYAIAILLIIAIYMLIRQGKLLTMQTSIMVAMAAKMGLQVTEPGKRQDQGKQPEGDEQRQRQLSEEEEDKIIIEEMSRISELIAKKEILSKKDEKYYIQYFDEMHEDLKLQSPANITHPSRENHKRLSAEEKKQVILTFFSDEIAKPIQDLSKMLAKSTGTKPNEGNTHVLLKGLIEDGKLFSQEIKHSGKKKMFYALPDMMEGKKIKKENLPA